MANRRQLLARAHGGWRGTRERGDGLGRRDAVGDGECDIASDRAEVVAVEPEVQVRHRMKMVEQRTAVQRQVGIGEPGQIDRGELSIDTRDRRLQFFGPPFDNRASRRVGERLRRQSRPASELGVNPRHHPEDPRRWELGGTPVRPDQRDRPGVHEAVDESGRDRSNRRTQLTEDPSHTGLHAGLDEPLRYRSRPARVVRAVKGPLAGAGSQPVGRTGGFGGGHVFGRGHQRLALVGLGTFDHMGERTRRVVGVGGPPRAHLRLATCCRR